MARHGFLAQLFTYRYETDDLSTLPLGHASPTVSESTPEATSAELLARVALLKRVPILFSIASAELRDLARRLKAVAAGPNDVIIRAGQQADSVFIVAAGRCEVRASYGGHSMTIALLSAGDFFGLDAISVSEPYGKSVVAVNDCRLFVLSRPDLMEVLGSESQAMERLRQLAQQHRDSQDTLSKRSFTSAAERSAVLIGVYSTKGGSGKSTIALNLAASLGQTRPGQVVLVDLALPFNHAAMMANLVPTRALGLVAGAAEDDFEDAILSMLIPHQSGFMLLPATLQAQDAELITADLARRVASFVACNFDYVVFDLGSNVGETVLRVLEMVHQVVFVVTPEFTNLKDTADMLRLMTGVLGVPPGCIRLVLNNPRPTSRIRKADCERVLDRRVAFEIRYDGPQLDKAAAKGEILAWTEPDGHWAHAIHSLGTRMLPPMQIAN